ncbi:hypothetical protein PPERSA_08054 [Pseudocohnilembus persalinus]|uniref:Uncharacterized protein n=1 Tax=Pseudocohnilembus persalinus TaxID=266149 RepID=A0A0V0R2L5_PSEPJ|nr:hypothetical protein PPERSA_08054 [Pseudocohnilembus persalinus]|eukprot:KRX08743.1 hypothetical protein PPERSA_08054 [Pseudocohnilembus persalinus]
MLKIGDKFRQVGTYQFQKGIKLHEIFYLLYDHINNFPQIFPFVKKMYFKKQLLNVQGYLKDYDVKIYQSEPNLFYCTIKEKKFQEFMNSQYLIEILFEFQIQENQQINAKIYSESIKNVYGINSYVKILEGIEAKIMSLRQSQEQNYNHYLKQQILNQFKGKKQGENVTRIQINWKQVQNKLFDIINKQLTNSQQSQYQEVDKIDPQILERNIYHRTFPSILDLRFR